MKAKPKCKTTNIKVQNQQKGYQALVDVIDAFLNNHGPALEETTDRAWNIGETIQHFCLDCAKSNDTETHISATILKNSYIKTEPSHETKRLSMKFVLENTYRANKKNFA